MPYSMNCPACGEGVEVADQHRGWTVRCPVCGSEFQAGEAGPTAADAPRVWRAPPPSYEVVEPGTAVQALREVSGPASALAVVGWIGVALSLLGVGVWIGLLAMAENDPQFVQGMGKNPDEFYAEAAGYLVAGAIQLGLSVVVVVGARRMGRLEGYGLAMTASIFAMIPCVGPCCLLGLPFGIWSVTVLNRRDVKAAFDRRAYGERVSRDLDDD